MPKEYYGEPSSKIEYPKTSISDLSLELVDQIVQLLHIKSQIYLAFSCTSLYICYRHVLADELAFPRYTFGCGWLPYGLPTETSYWEPHLRRQLLCWFQGTKRLYCSSCIKLHLDNEFESSEREYSTEINRRCKYPVFVNICPCSPLNIREMARMLERYQHKWLEWHHCSITLQPEVVANQKIYISQDEQTYLRVRSQWEILYKKETNRFWPNIERFFSCPHKCMLPEFLERRSQNGQLRKCHTCKLDMKTNWNEVDQNQCQVEITRTVNAHEVLKKNKKK